MKGHRGETDGPPDSFFRLYKPILQFLKICGFTSLKNLWKRDSGTVHQKWVSFDFMYPLMLVFFVNYVLFSFRIKSKLAPEFIVLSSDLVALILINCLYMIQNFLVVISYLNSDRKLPALLQSLDFYDRARGRLKKLRKYHLPHIPNLFSFLAILAYFTYSEWWQVMDVISALLDQAPVVELLKSMAWALILLYYFLVWDIVPYLIILFCLEIKWRFAELRDFTRVCLNFMKSGRPSSYKQELILEELRLLHGNLCQTTLLLSETFGFQLLVMFLNKYLNIIFTLYLAFFRRNMTMDGNIQVLIFDYVNAFIISLLSEKIDHESKIFETDLEVIQFDSLTKDGQIVVHLFLSQTRGRSIKVNVCGFFILDRLLFSSMTVTLVTHFIVIMQMTPDLHKLLKSSVDPARYDGSHDPAWTKSI